MVSPHNRNQSKIFLKQSSRFVRIFFTFVFLYYKMNFLLFLIQQELITSSFCKILGWSIQYSVICKVHYRTLQYLPTLARKNLCVPSKSTQAGLDGCWKKKALSVRRICQLATILEGQSSALDWIHISHFWIYHLSKITI